MDQLLGNTLQRGDSDVQTAEAFADCKAVALYFSAHWCPPCRGFTPKLAEWYTKDLKAKGLEVVFVSSDKDEGQFKEYYGEMPWLALPYADRDKKNALSKKFKVSGIPSLVIVDPATGKTITAEGREAVSKDPTGEKLPWTPPTKEEKRQAVKDMLSQATLVDKDGTQFSGSDRLTKDFIGLYFSAHWCPPCRGFTPQLAGWYNDGLKDKMEVVFLSSDQDEGQFKEYLGEMPWVALSYEKRSEKETLSDMFGVEGIPTFVVLDKDFNVITTEGRGKVTSDPKGESLPDGWLPQPYNDANDNPSDLNGETCVVVMGSTGDGVQEVAKEHHAAANGEVDEMKYRFYTAPQGGVESQLRKLTKSADAGEFLLILDIPDEGGYYNCGADVSADAIRAALQKYEAKELERQQLN